MTSLPQHLVHAFQEIVSASGLITPENPDMEPYLKEWRDKYHGRAALVVLPRNTSEVSQVMKLAGEHQLSIVPQGGNTGVVGGQIPFDKGDEIILNLSKMNKVRQVDAQTNALYLDAGVTLENAQKAADEAGRLFPLSLASQGSCQIGGNLATNAGGVNVLAYGNMRELTLGLEVVLADGQIWDGLRALRKDNTGYDMKDLFIGSEGTLGIITGAVLRLFPKPAEKASAFLGVKSLEDISRFFDMANEAGGGVLSAFEILPKIGLEFTLKHAENVRHPLETASNWYILLEISNAQPDGLANIALENVLEKAFEKEIIEDAALAGSLKQAKEFWRLRELMSAMQKPEGGSIKHDVSVPIAKIPEFINRASQAVTQLVPGCRPVPFGHFGDGNIHYNISQPPGMDKHDYLGHWEAMSEIVHGLVGELNGSISAEHGIGRMKKQMLKQHKSPVELALMQSIKQTLDPQGILNPGKVL